MAGTPANAIGVTTPGAVSFNGTTFTGSTLTVADGGTDSTSFSINGAVFSNTTTTGALQSATLTDGQLLIGSTAGAPAAATLTAGSGIAITNGSHSIEIAATGPTFTWSDKNASFAAASDNGYFITATATGTLPASPADGDEVDFIVTAAATVLTITGNTGQIIRFGAVATAPAGTAVSSAQGDSVTLVYHSASTTWLADGAPVGNWVLT